MSKYPFILIMCMFIAQSVFAQSYSKYFRLANQDTVNFTFTVKKPDINGKSTQTIPLNSQQFDPC